jgi:hypothetical protein
MANINNITDQSQRQQIARNLQLHAHYLSVINSGIIFDSNLHVLKVQRGLYNPGPTEVPTSGGLNDLATQGRCVVYQLVNKLSGNVEISKTYDLAVYLKDYIYFDKLILDYDTYDPSGVMAAHIIIVTPTMPETYQNASYGNAIETRYNGKTMYSDLVDCYQPVGAAVNTSTSGAGVSGVFPADGVVRWVTPPGNPNLIPKQNIINAIATAVRTLGTGYDARITDNGGIARRAAGTINHILGDAADHRLYRNGQPLFPEDHPQLYRQYINTLVDNAESRGIRPGIGGYGRREGNFIHYDEAPHRQGKLGRAGVWNNGFDVSFVLV